MSRQNETRGEFFDILTDRVEQVRKDLKLNRRAFCELIRFDYGRYHHITGERNSKPTADLLGAVARFTNVNESWLLKGVGPRYREEGKKGGMHDEYVLIPLFSVHGGAGDGRLVSGEEVEDLLAFKRSWIAQELRTNPENLALIHVQGESMVPTLSPGDVILLQLDEKGQGGDGIYVLRMGEALLIKRLQFLPDGEVNVTSDNASYQPFRVSLHAQGDEFGIVGRVVWGGRRF
ncbi:MAG: helix-turn-helix domain-containing protein [Deltaproteobacteria bacterium]|nr:helix-turn-helix domain-containing protein [Deltaproteobacteria bacterium]